MSKLKPKDVLKKIRYEFAISQREFAEIIDLPQKTYSLYELGKVQPSLKTIRKIVKKLKAKKVKIDYIDLIDDK